MLLAVDSGIWLTTWAQMIFAPRQRMMCRICHAVQGSTDLSLKQNMKQKQWSTISQPRERQGENATIKYTYNVLVICPGSHQVGNPALPTLQCFRIHFPPSKEDYQSTSIKMFSGMKKIKVILFLGPFIVGRLPYLVIISALKVTNQQTEIEQSPWGLSACPKA